MDYNNQQQPPPPPSQSFGAWSVFPHNLPGFPFNLSDHEVFRQYGSVVDHPDAPAHKRARQSEDNLPNFPPLPMNSRINPPAVSAGVKVGTGHIFYKTRLCTKFSDGNCINGDSCNFAHGANDLRHPPPNWKELVGGRDSGTGRSDQNMRVCKKYYNGEVCPYGEKCVFLHQRPTPSLFDEGQMGMAERAGESQSAANNVVLSSNHGRTGGYRSETNKPPLYWKSNPGERSNFDHVQTASLSHNEVETMVKSRVIQSAAPFGDPSAVAVTGGDPTRRRAKYDDDSRWKLNKKINRIYGDWIDDLSPPRNVEADAET